MLLPCPPQGWHTTSSRVDQTLFHKFESLASVAGREPSGDGLYIPKVEGPETFSKVWLRSPFDFVIEFIPE